MKRSTIQNKLCQTAAALLSVCIITSGSAVAANSSSPDELRGQMESAKSAALSYISGQDYYFAHLSLTEYASTARTLADAEQLHPYFADTSAALRDAYDYSPEIYAVTGGSKVFMGSDGYFADGADAVRLNVPFDYAPVSDYIHLIPNTSRELCILVSLEVESERSMINIAAGAKDERLIEDLRTLSRIEGRLYLTFCPAVNNQSSSRSLNMSYIAAFRHIADMARRYAPNVSMVYSLGDRIAAGDDTVSRFYPGDSYVDVFGVELVNIPESLSASAEASAWNRRGEYYDPVYSVQFLSEIFSEVTGRDVPIMVTGCSFPWDGYSAREDWADAMEEFYTVLPRLLPNLAAIFYTNESSSYGICNLRQNKTAAALYEKCITADTATAAPFESLERVNVGEPTEIFAYTRRVFGTESFEIFLDGVSANGEVTFTAGDHTLEVYLLGDYFYSKLGYSLNVQENGNIKTQLITPDYDYNGNGILDFGDSEMLSAYIAKWQVDMNGLSTDVNGDGKTNIRDISALETLMAP